MHQPAQRLDLEQPRDLERFDDPLVVAHGHLVGSPYFHRYWLPTIGPSTACLVLTILEHAGTARSFAELGVAIGVRSSDVVRRTVHRAIGFELIRVTDDAIVAAGHVGPLPQHQLKRLPSWLTIEAPAR